MRKLPTISPTPMVTETATISAATATAVRLSAPETLRGAIRPSTPKIARASGSDAAEENQREGRRQQGKADGEEEDACEADHQAPA